MEFVDQRPEFIDAVVEEVADQHIGNQALFIGVTAYQFAEVQAVVEGTHELLHTVHPANVFRLPASQAGLARVVRGQGITHRIGRHRCRRECEQYTRRVQWIEEAEGVADEYPTVTRGFRGAVRVFLLRTERVAAGCVFEPRMQTGAQCDFFVVNRFEVFRFPVLEQVFVPGYHAHADDVVVQRDVPKPALFSLGLQHNRCAFVLADVAIGTLPVRPDGGLLELRIPLTQPEAIENQRRLPTGVDHDFRADDLFGLIFDFDSHADGASAIEHDFVNARTFVNFDAVFAGVVQQHLVEFAAANLPRLAAFVRVVLGKVERFRQSATLGYELHAVLLDEVAALHFIEHVQPLQHRVGVRDQRFADVKTRKMFALEQLDRMPFLGE